MKKILVVDDQNDIREVLKIRLEANGYQVQLAKDGQEALDIVGSAPVDLVILDVMMPTLNGYSVCLQLKSDDSPYKHIPIILLTARSQEIEPMYSQGVGIQYLQKPLDSAVLLSMIKDALAQADSSKNP